MENIINEYRLLLNDLNNPNIKFPEQGMTVFNSRKGKEYKNELMIVGRAVNGWLYDFKKNEEGSVEKILSNITKDLTTEWDLFDCYRYETKNPKKPYYYPSKSAFCRVKQTLAAKITQGEKNYANNSIVSSNLYKISNQKGGNPSSKLINAQFKYCLNILKYEIELHRPKIIIFLTGAYATRFLNELGIKNTLDKGKQMKYVQFVGNYSESKIVVGQHPQGKNEVAHIAEILEVLN